MPAETCLCRIQSEGERKSPCGGYYQRYTPTTTVRTLHPWTLRHAAPRAATDVAVLLSTFGKPTRDPGSISYLDYNGDGVIDDTDRQALIAHHGTSLPPP